MYGNALGDAFMALMYVAAFAVFLVLALIVGGLLSIFLPVPLWALLIGSGAFAVVASAVAVRLMR